LHQISNFPQRSPIPLAGGGGLAALSPRTPPSALRVSASALWALGFGPTGLGLRAEALSPPCEEKDFAPSK